MKKHKFSIFTIIILVLLIISYIYREHIVIFAMENIAQNTTVNSPKSNKYTTNYNFELINTTNQFHVKNKEDILNVVFTVLNSGQTDFTFFCDKNYKNCDKQLKTISEDNTLLSVINNMVSPYNSYEKLFITINKYGKATIKYEPLYSQEDIQTIENKINEIEKEIIKENMTDKEKIKAFHDYLINNTIYDEEKAKEIENGNTESNGNNSHKALGPLVEGKALCSGYSDAMKIYLDRLNIPNYKISNNNHIWNLVYINGKWLHLDLTWDDPVTSDHSNILLDKFFLIDTQKLESLDTTNHNFNKKYYKEA